MTRADPDRFEQMTAPLRRELLAHCYRMTGSAQDAEDLVQEAYLRAWRSFERFEGRSSLRTWMYRIATNVCLTALKGRSRRVLPSGLGAPSHDPHAPPVRAGADVAWLEPIPDRLVIDDREDPATVTAARQTVRLALVAAAQILPPRQRAAFLLCDVLDQRATEAAAMLEVSVPALKSLLQRARATLARETVDDEELADPDDPGARAVLDRYIAAFENSDVEEIGQVLADDAVLEMTGSTSWFSGKATCLPFIAGQAIGNPGDWLLDPIEANGQLAAAAYLRDESGTHRPFAIVVLATTRTHLSRISLFGDVALFERLGLPARPAERGRGSVDPRP